MLRNLLIKSILFTLFCVNGGNAFSGDIKMYPLPEKSVLIEGDKIYCNGQLFAELRYFWTHEPTNSHHGLAIYYYPYNKEVWIVPKEGWSTKLDNKEYFAISDLNRIEKEFRGKPITDKGPYRLIGGNPPEKEQLIRSRVTDIKISEDGKYVNYKTDGMFFKSSHKYLVEYGVSE